jgi:hypothetical protein
MQMMNGLEPHMDETFSEDKLPYVVLNFGLFTKNPYKELAGIPISGYQEYAVISNDLRNAGINNDKIDESIEALSNPNDHVRLSEVVEP